MIETRAVLAGAYLSRLRHATWTRSHAVDLDADGMERASLADRGAADPSAAPTCPVCLRRLARTIRQEGAR